MEDWFIPLPDIVLIHPCIFFFFVCECGAPKLHTTLEALEWVAFLVWAVSLLWFVCGERVCVTQLTWMLCWSV
jgi:hypothetical protein